MKCRNWVLRPSRKISDRKAGWKTGPWDNSYGRSQGPPANKVSILDYEKTNLGLWKCHHTLLSIWDLLGRFSPFILREEFHNWHVLNSCTQRLPTSRDKNKKIGKVKLRLIRKAKWISMGRGSQQKKTSKNKTNHTS